MNKENISMLLWFLIPFLFGVISTVIFYNFIYAGFIPKNLVLDAFKDVKWSSNTFQCAEKLMSDNKGRTHFYAVDSIDSAVEKLNKYLSQ